MSARYHIDSVRRNCLGLYWDLKGYNGGFHHTLTIKIIYAFKCSKKCVENLYVVKHLQWENPLLLA